MKSRKSLLGSFVSGLTLLAACVALAGCASNSLPLPTITGISPNSVSAGGAGFTLKVMGTGFLNTDVVEWNGQVLATQPVSGTELDAQVPASLLAAGAQAKASFRLANLKQRHAQVAPEQTGDVTVDITVLQKPPGSVVSNTFTFTITPSNPTPALTITKTHSGNFTQGQAGATFTITVSNAGNGPTDGSAVTTTELPPSSLTVTNMIGSGWTCVLSSLSCTRNDALAADSSYPVITVTASVATNAPATITNNVAVSGGGSTSGTGTDMVTVTPPSTPALKITKTHTGNFTQGQTGATFTVTVSNAGTGTTSGAVTVSDTAPAGLTITGLSGNGWSCTVTTGSCTRSDPLSAGGTYPAITVTVNVATNAPTSVTNTVSVSGGGSTTGSANDTVTVVPPPSPALKITKTHTGNFTQGQTGATFTVTVSNTGTGPSSGTVTVSDTPPTGLAIVNLSGSGWTCNSTTASCTRSDVLTAGSSYSAITVTVNVATNAPASVTNTASASGGGSPTPASASDTVTVSAAGTPVLSVTKTHVGNFAQGGTGMYTIAVSNSGTGPTSGTVNVADTIPAGLTAITLTGTGWTCSIGVTVGCSRGDSLAGGSSYPAITLTVSVSTSAPATVTNNVIVTNGSRTASVSDPTVINSAGGPAFTVTATRPTSATFNNNLTVYFVVKNTGTSPTSGTVTVQVGSPSSLFLPVFIFGDPWNCQSGTLTCTRSDVLAAGQSYPPIGITFQILSGAPSPFTVSATASGGGTASNASVNASTPVVNCSPSSGLLCGQFVLFTQGYDSNGARAIVASFTADGNGNITAGTVDVNSAGITAGPPTGLSVIPGAPTGYNFESNGFGNIVLNTVVGAFTFKFIPTNLGTFADVIEFEPGGTIGGSGSLLQQNPAYTADGVSGGYALGLLGGLGGGSGLRLGMIGAINANGACGFSASGSTGTINDGGSVSTAVNFSGTLNPASCTVDPTTGRGTASFSSLTGSPAPSFSGANFAYYILGTNITGQATSVVLLSIDQTSTTQPLLSGTATLQANAPYNTNAAIDCGVSGNPSSSTGCVFASSGATGGNVLTGNAHVAAGVATVTTQSNTAGSVNLLLDDNKGGTVTSGNTTATYSYQADGTGIITPVSAENTAFVLTGIDSGFTLGLGGSVSFGTLVPQTATDISTTTPANFIASTRLEGTQAVTNTLVNSTFTPSSPGSNSGAISGNTRSWNTSTFQTSNTLAGSYTTSAIPATGRGTGTTSASNGIAGAASFTYYVINANSFVLIGAQTSGTGSTTPVLMSFQGP